MKNLFLIFMASIVLMGCGAPSESEFIEYSEEFYIQMFTDGNQSEAVTEMYGKFIEEYDGFKSEALYANIEGMYKALGNEESATPYQMEVMRILNEY